MSASRPRTFSPPSDGFWTRLAETALTDLLRGRVTGLGSPRRLIARANLPDEVKSAVWTALQTWRTSRGRQRRMARDLIAFSQRSLSDGAAASHVAEEVVECPRVVALLGLPVSTKNLEQAAIWQRSVPRNLGEVIERTIAHVRATPLRRKEAAAGLYKRVAAELSAGVLADSLVERFGDAALVASFLKRPRRRDAVLDASLPTSLLRIVRRVLQRTRLWPSEQDDVACELSAHFADGMAAGRTAEVLATEFGSPEAAARLIRRAKKRGRPLGWHVARRGLQTSLLLAGVLLIVWCGLAMRYYRAAPVVARDYVGEEDQKTGAISTADRAWPLYRQGLEKLDRTF
jgi:hypothetical protein